MLSPSGQHPPLSALHQRPPTSTFHSVSFPHNSHTNTILSKAHPPYLPLRELIPPLRQALALHSVPSTLYNIFSKPSSHSTLVGVFPISLPHRCMPRCYSTFLSVAPSALDKQIQQFRDRPFFLISSFPEMLINLHCSFRFQQDKAERK